MADYNVNVNEDGEMELISSETGNFDALLADEVVMDWLLKLEAEDAAAEALEEEQMRRARLLD